MIRWISAISAALALTLSLAATPALAHSTKQSTLPGDGETLSASPDAISMTFDKPIRITMLKLTDGSGGAHEVDRTDAMEPLTEFSASPPVLGPGDYTVEWRGLSEDGHPMSGTFSFKIEQ